MTVVPDHTLRCAWRGDFGSTHSLAVVNDGAAGAVEAAGVDVIRCGWNDRQLDESIVGIAGQWPPRFEAPSAGPFVLYQPWEFGRVPALWVDEIRRRIDEVWTPSESVRQAYVRSGVAPGLVHVVPNGVDTERFTPAGELWPLPTSKGTVLLFVGGLIYRKGVDILLEAYAEAFSDEDDVCLAIKAFGAGSVYRGMTAEACRRPVPARPGAPEILLIDEEVPFDRLPSLYRSADALVQPYRGEGFCLPVLEALACGVPSSSPRAARPTSSRPRTAPGASLPSRSRSRPDALPDELQPAGEPFMLEPSVDALVGILRAGRRPRARAAKAAAAREHAERLSWTRVGEIARGRLEALAGRTPIRSIAEAVVPGRRGTALRRRRATGRGALRAYAAAFAHDADTTLALPCTPGARRRRAGRCRDRSRRTRRRRPRRHRTRPRSARARRRRRHRRRPRPAAPRPPHRPPRPGRPPRGRRFLGEITWVFASPRSKQATPPKRRSNESPVARLERMLAAAGAAIRQGRPEELEQLHAELSTWDDPQRAFQARRQLAELVFATQGTLDERRLDPGLRRDRPRTARRAGREPRRARAPRTTPACCSTSCSRRRRRAALPAPPAGSTPSSTTSATTSTPRARASAPRRPRLWARRHEAGWRSPPAPARSPPPRQPAHG